MQETMINHPRLRVVRNTGTEGPRCDPYSYEELDITTPTHNATVHFGLGDWATLDGKKVFDGIPSEELARYLRYDFLSEVTGFTYQQLERIRHRLASRCRKCGGREFESVSGYPGEYFDICVKCEHINGTQFYISEIE